MAHWIGSIFPMDGALADAIGAVIDFHDKPPAPEPMPPFVTTHKLADGSVRTVETPQHRVNLRYKITIDLFNAAVVCRPVGDDTRLWSILLAKAPDVVLIARADSTSVLCGRDEITSGLRELMA